MKAIPKKVQITLCKFSGEDYTIIDKCDFKVKRYFSFIGLFVLIILISCFVSALYFTLHLFQNPFFKIVSGISLGLIWGYIVTNMYVLLLYTISPPLLPTKTKEKGKFIENPFNLTFSMYLRIGIVILLAIITAQPINVLLFNPSSISLAKDIKLLLSSNFFALLFTMLMIVVFLLPIIWKYRIRKFTEFYEKKSAIEKEIVSTNYQNYIIKYEEIFKEKLRDYNQLLEKTLMSNLNKLEKINPDLYDEIYTELKNELLINKVKKYEYWKNPPYRTKRKKQEKQLLTEKDLLKHIYPLED